jgi:uncharacterized protein YjbJ (UPF0337 family)
MFPHLWIAIVLLEHLALTRVLRVSANKPRRPPMNWDRVQGNWKQFSGKVKEQWGKLTDDDMTQIDGNREQLEGKIQARYGFAKDQVKKDVDAWLNRSS